MMATDDGYVKEIDYTHGYCNELSPARLELACLARSLQPFPADRPIRYLELAFGQGVSLNIHAAACAGEFWGIDFHPAHAANARDLASAAGSGVRLFQDAFAEFAVRRDVPQFDVIAMHGTWSWVSAENRHLVVDILRRSLTPGGLFFVSYNCWPGWATELPLRHLLTQHAGLADSSRGLAERMDASMEFAQAMIDAGASYFTAHPRLKDWLADMRGRSRSYLAHEYFNRDWHPMPFSEVARALSAADLHFAASANLAGQGDGLGLTDKARALLAGIDDPVMRETTLDYLVNQRFRRDIFVKEGRPAAHPEACNERIRDIAFMLLQHPEYVPAKATLAGSIVELPDSVYRPFVQAMAVDNYAPKTLRQVEKHPRCAAIPPTQLVEAALVLTETGSMHPVRPPQIAKDAAARCKALNARILERAQTSGDVSALASPVIGAGAFVAREEMLFLCSIAQGKSDPDEWARYAWEKLSEGDPAALRSAARAFARIRLPVLKALGVA